MNYDDWLVHMEHEHRGWNEPENECQHCGEPTEKSYCSDDCFNADML